MAYLMTTKQFAERMGWSEHTVHQRRYLGLPMPPSIKLPNGPIRWRDSDVERWLAEHVEANDWPAA